MYTKMTIYSVNCKISKAVKQWLNDNKYIFMIITLTAKSWSAFNWGFFFKYFLSARNVSMDDTFFYHELPHES